MPGFTFDSLGGEEAAGGTDSNVETSSPPRAVLIDLFPWENMYGHTGCCGLPPAPRPSLPPAVRQYCSSRFHRSALSLPGGILQSLAWSEQSERKLFMKINLPRLMPAEE